MFLRPEAVLALQLEGNDVVLGLKEGVEGLAGDAGTLADLADADAAVGLLLHQGEQRARDRGLRGECGFVASFVHGNSCFVMGEKTIFRRPKSKNNMNNLDNCKVQCYYLSYQILDRCQGMASR